jgi:hypothetical protein
MLRAWEFSGDIACVNVTANGHDATVALMTYILEREKPLVTRYANFGQAICDIADVYFSQAF